MAAIKVSRAEQYPGHSVWGSQGSAQEPLVYVGDHVLGNEKQPGCSVYLSEREINDACKAMFGATYTATVQRLAELEDAIAGEEDKNRLLSEQLADLTKQLEAYTYLEETLKAKVAA